MRKSVILVGGVAVSFAAVVSWTQSVRYDRFSVVSAHPAPRVLAPSGAFPSRASVNDPAPPEDVAHATPRFTWVQLESTNYLEYVSALRGIGCPPETIRHILRGELFSTVHGRELAADDEVEKMVSAIVAPGDSPFQTQPLLHGETLTRSNANAGVELQRLTEKRPYESVGSKVTQPDPLAPSAAEGSTSRQPIVSTGSVRVNGESERAQFPGVPLEDEGDIEITEPPLLHPDMFPITEIAPPIEDDPGIESPFAGESDNGQAPGLDAVGGDDLRGGFTDDAGSERARELLAQSPGSGTTNLVRIPRAALEEIARRHALPPGHVVAAWFLYKLAANEPSSAATRLKSAAAELLGPEASRDLTAVAP